MYKFMIATFALFILTVPSLAIESDFVHSLRADNGDFEPPHVFTSHLSSVPNALVDPVQTESAGTAGAVSTSKCMGVSPRMYDPLGPDCRN